MCPVVRQDPLPPVGPHEEARYETVNKNIVTGVKKGMEERKMFYISVPFTVGFFLILK